MKGLLDMGYPVKGNFESPQDRIMHFASYLFAVSDMMTSLLGCEFITSCLCLVGGNLKCNII